MCSRVVVGILEYEVYTGEAMVCVAWGYVACLDEIEVVCARGLWLGFSSTRSTRARQWWVLRGGGVCGVP